jgi:hypothetical protein
MKTWPLLLGLSLLPLATLAQGDMTKLERPGRHTKFLTPNQLDRWVFDGEKGETVTAHVTTREFDPILDLSVKVGNEDKTVVPEVDDEGSESRFSVRLPDKGQYSIRIHAFKFQGGGNYSLEVTRYQANPLAIGQPVTGAFDREGRAYFYFEAVKDRFLVPELKGTPSPWRIQDSKGRDMEQWAGTVKVEENGEHALLVSGRPENRFDLLVREAQRHDLTASQAAAGRLLQGEMDVWSFQGKPGDFRLLELEKKGDLISQVVYAPLEKKKEQRLVRPGERPELQFLPVASRGGRQRFAALLGREGRYQLHLVANSPVSYSLTMADPTLLLERKKEAAGNLSVGGAAFYSFQAAPGQLLHLRLASQKFVPFLHFYDPSGRAIETGADPDALQSRATHMVIQEGLYRVQVASLGDGGGGDYRLALEEEKLKGLEVGGRERGALQPNSTEFWSFPGLEGKTVFISVRSTNCHPTVSVRSPDGVSLASDNNPGGGTDCLLSVKLPKTGRYTLWISSRRGAGDYTLRLIDGD